MECDYLKREIKLTRREAKMIMFYYKDDPSTAFINKLRSNLHAKGVSDYNGYEGIFPGEPCGELCDIDYYHSFRLFYDRTDKMETDAAKLEDFIRRGFIESALKYVKYEFSI